MWREFLKPSAHPEFAFVCACIGWPPSPSHLARVRAAADTVDADMLVRVARRHDVATQVADVMRQAGLDVPPRLDRIAQRRRRQALKQVAATIDLRDRFAVVDIPLLVLKGVALSQRLYASPVLRGAADIDLVVPRDTVERAWSVLRDAGYTMLIPSRPLTGEVLRTFLWAAKDSQHRHPTTGVVIELHWRLSDDLADPVPPAAHRWLAIALGPNATVRTLGDDDLFVYLCTHGAAHLWARLKWLADIAVLIRRSGDGGARYWRIARRAGAARPAASAFMLAEELLGTPLPPGFHVPRSWRLMLLNRLALRVVTAGGGATELAATPYRGWAEIIAKLLIAPRWRNRIATLRRLAISGEDVGELAFPRGFAFLYPLVRIPRMIVRRRRRAERRKSRRETVAADAHAKHLQ
jgi:chorismate mutase